MAYRVLDLFSGIGGFSLGLERTSGFKTVAFCEIEPFCRRVLAKHWPEVPCYDDVRTLSADRLTADGVAVDVICGGFPCQNVSSSGDKTGLDGARSGLWVEFCRLIRELRPRYAIVENVSDLLNRGLGEVLGDLAESGYDAEWHSIPASFVGMPQARERVWVVAYPDGRGRKISPQRDRSRPIVVLRADDDGLALAQRRAREAALGKCRVADGLSRGVDRVGACGNAVVPQIPELIGRAILAAEESAALVRRSPPGFG
jgi:DNA (cytosine-5)-methyltransferase 1